MGSKKHNKISGQKSCFHARSINSYAPVGAGLMLQRCRPLIPARPNACPSALASCASCLPCPGSPRLRHIVVAACRCKGSLRFWELTFMRSRGYLLRPFRFCVRFAELSITARTREGPQSQASQERWEIKQKQCRGKYSNCISIERLEMYRHRENGVWDECLKRYFFTERT